MKGRPKATQSPVKLHHRGPWNTRVGVITVLVASLAVVITVLYAITSADDTPFHIFSGPTVKYPVGVVDSSEPSGKAPPSAKALAGYRLDYVTDFPGKKLPPGWDVFTGIPGGDPGGHFASNHVVVAGGELHVNTWRDPAFQNTWVTGGLCQCEVARTYGAYFVRSRDTGPGPNDVELLWPASNVWPPEIDFNENSGKMDSTSSTLHFSAINQIDQRIVHINMRQWHTWGLIWTPKAVTYVVDGKVWGTISTSAEVARKPMTLDIEERQQCQLGFQCPTHPVSMLIDWVAEYGAAST